MMKATALDRDAWLAPLGLQRFRVLDCLGGTDPRSPGYLERPPATDVFAAFRSHVQMLSRRWDNRHEQTTRLLAAARVLIGDLGAADVILDRLPATAYRLDHGHGHCNVADIYALSVALPLPATLKDTTRWLAGSGEQAGLRSWLSSYRVHL